MSSASLRFPKYDVCSVLIESERESCSIMSDSLWPHRLYRTWNSPGQNTGMCSFSFPFSRGSSQLRDWIQVFCIAGGFFTSWATREAQKYWSEWSIPSPDLPDPGIEPGSPALQADSLSMELSGKPFCTHSWIPHMVMVMMMMKILMVVMIILKIYSSQEYRLWHN